MEPPERLAMKLTPIAIGPAEGRALRDWVRGEGALHTLETGLGYAVSTLFICEGLIANGPDGRHVAMDPGLPGSHACEGLETLEQAGVRDLIDFYDEGSEVVLPRLLSEGRTFDLERTKAARMNTNGSFSAPARPMPSNGRSTAS